MAAKLKGRKPDKPWHKPGRVSPSNPKLKKQLFKKVGRPDEYTRLVNLEQVKVLVGKGFTDRELALFYGVTEQTINHWKINHPEFFSTIKEAKFGHDGLVERALLERATGYEHYEDHILSSGEIVPTTKHYPPDATSAIFWLKNRQPQRWRDKTEQDVNLTGEMRIDNLSKEEKAKRAADILKRLKISGGSGEGTV